MFTSQVVRVSQQDYQSAWTATTLICQPNNHEVRIQGAKLEDLVDQIIELIYHRQRLCGLLILRTGRWHLVHVPSPRQQILPAWLGWIMSGYGLVAGIYGAIDQRWIFLIHCIVLLACGLLLLRGNARLAAGAKSQEVDFISSFKQFISEAKDRLSAEDLNSSFLRKSVPPVEKPSEPSSPHRKATVIPHTNTEHSTDQATKQSAD